MDRKGIPTDGPDSALERIARRLNLRYSNTYVARAVARHAQPSSLLALVEVAPTLGLKVTPGRTEVAELAAIEGPAIVHFDGGFGVLEGISGDGFEVWDSQRGSHVIDRERFLKFWSGIVVLVERDPEARGHEDGFRRHRLVEIFFGSAEPPAVIGSRRTNLVRGVLATSAAVLLALGLASLPTADRIPALAITLLSILGLAVAVIAAMSVASENNPLADRICARGKYVNCQSILSSQFSRFLGFPMADIGIALYAGILFLVAVGGIATAWTQSWFVISLVFLASVPFSLALIGVQLAMRQICTLCFAVHAVNLSSAAIAWFWLRPETPAFRDALPATLLFGFSFALVLFFVVPYFRKHQGMTTLGKMYWRISGSPFASLADVLAEAPTEVRPSTLAVTLGDSAAVHELVLFVHPSCNKCNSVLAEARGLMQAGLVRVSVGVAPKDPEESDRRMCAAMVAAGMGAAPPEVVYVTAKKDLKAMMGPDPVGVLANGLSTDRAAIERGAIERHADRAREMVLATERFVDDHAEGTPAVFLDSRLFRGELSHLAFLLQQHPDLLEPILPASFEGRDVAAVSR